MYVVYRVPGGWQVLHINGDEAVFVALAADEAAARHIASLLTRHGTVDVPLTPPSP